MSQDFGLDRSGNTNHWEVHNMTYGNQVIDTPTNNFPVLNPNCCHQDMPIVGGTKLMGNASGGTAGCTATMSIPSTGKWYWEVFVENLDSNRPNHYYGVDEIEVLTHRTLNNLASGHLATTYVYQSNGNGTRNNNSESSYGGAWSDNNIIGVALDMDNGTLKYFRNNTAESSGANAFTGLGSKRLVPSFGLYRDGANSASNACIINFGQDSSFQGNLTPPGNQDGNDIGDFYYTPPTNYLALCTSNLPDVTINKPEEQFDVITYTGSGVARTITGLEFDPDLILIKNRTTNETHFNLWDSLRGAGERLIPNHTYAEETQTGDFPADGFDVTGGFKVGTGNIINQNNASMVAWCWKSPTQTNQSAPSSGLASVTQTDTAAGISIVTWTGAGENNGDRVKHGLGATPELIIMKYREDNSSYYTWSNQLTSNSYELYLNDGADETAGGQWNGATINSTYFQFDDAGFAAGNGYDNVAWCFRSIEGYSRIGKYTGNANADGAFIYTGFRPRMILSKRISADEDWHIRDTNRDGYNPGGNTLRVNYNYTEYNNCGSSGNTCLDILSNGFKQRGADTSFNDGTYIYIAFAETPFKYANAR